MQRRKINVKKKKKEEYAKTTNKEKQSKPGKM